jgi:hypothetical protein
MSEPLDPIKLEDMRQKNGDRISMLSQDETKILFDVLGILEMPKNELPYLKFLLDERYGHLISIEGEKKKERTKPFQPAKPIPE